MEKNEKLYSVIHIKAGKKRIVFKGYDLNKKTPVNCVRVDIPFSVDPAMLLKRIALDSVKLSREDGAYISDKLPSDQLYKPLTTSIKDDPVDNLDPEKYKKDRKAQYPLISDQIDSIMKMAVHLRTNGLDIGIDGDSWVDACVKVKTDFPKPV